jgi:hypothetical protein
MVFSEGTVSLQKRRGRSAGRQFRLTGGSDKPWAPRLRTGIRHALSPEPDGPPSCQEVWIGPGVCNPVLAVTSARAWMRADMAKVIVERPRKKGCAWNKPKGYQRRLHRYGENGPPAREGIKAGGEKSFHTGSQLGDASEGLLFSGLPQVQAHGSGSY